MNISTELPSATIIMTFHGEGVYAHKSLLGFLRIRQYTQEYGGDLRLICMLDCADEFTTNIVKKFVAKYGDSTDSIIEVAYGSLAASRNVGIDHVQTQYAGFLDGDDFFSANWVVECLNTIKKSDNQLLLCFPSQVISFGSHISNQIIQPDTLIPKAQMINTHYWISSSFGHVSIFKQVPYNEFVSKKYKFSFEDWDFNIRCLALGVSLIPIQDTYFFYRRRESSMLSEHASMSSFVPPSDFFMPNNFNL